MVTGETCGAVAINGGLRAADGFGEWAVRKPS